jgi:hypothetical protein
MQGCPHTKRKNRIWFNDGEVQAWLNQNGRGTKPGRPPKQKTSEDLENDKDYWLAQKYKIQCQREQGKLISVDDVNILIGEVCTTIRNRCLGLPAAVIPHIQGRDPDEQQTILDQFMHEILNGLAGLSEKVADISAPTTTIQAI